MTIGMRIKEARRFRKMTQKQLAEAAHIAPGTIQQYELGKREPRHEILVNISRALNISVAALCDDTATPIERLTIESILGEINQSEKFHAYLKTLGYEIWSDYEFNGNRENTLVVDMNQEKLYVLSGNQYESFLVQSFEAYARFTLENLIAKATEIEDTEGWLADGASSN